MNDTTRQMLDRLLDDDLSTEEQSQLLKQLETDHEAIACLAERAMLLSDLQQSLQRRQLQRSVVAALPEAVQKAGRNKTRGWQRLLHPAGWAAAAAVLLLAVGGFFLRNHLNGDGGVMAEIVESQDAIPVNSWKAGQRVPMRQMTLESGRVSLRLPNGVLLDFEGPFQAEFISTNKLRLMRGKATADVGDAGKGFIIETVNARVVDLGTRFGVEVGTSNETDIVVFQGKVEVFDPARKNQPERPKITLTEGEGIRVDDSRKPRRMKMISLGANAQSLRSGTSSDIVTDVTDNVVEGDFRRYYGLLSGAMGEGARLHTTGHTHTWHAAPGAAFPRELLGADVICTYVADRQDADLQITLMIHRPCDVYVLPDARAVVPEWLQRDFVDTGLRLRSGPWFPRGMPTETCAKNPEDKAFVPHAVWKKRVAAPGPVTLGPPRAENQKATQVMYGIAVQALPPAP